MATVTDGEESFEVSAVMPTSQLHLQVSVLGECSLSGH